MVTTADVKVEKKDKKPTTAHLKAVPETRELRDRVRAAAFEAAKLFDRARLRSLKGVGRKAVRHDDSLDADPLDALPHVAAHGGDRGGCAQPLPGDPIEAEGIVGVPQQRDLVANSRFHEKAMQVQ